MLSDVFENCRNMFLEIYELDSNRFRTAPGLAWHVIFKKARVNLDGLVDIDIILMVENGFREGITHSIYRYLKTKNMYIKDSVKDKYWDVNSFYGRAMSISLSESTILPNLIKISEENYN